MDLRVIFGHRYVVSLDESWMAEPRANRREFLAKGEQRWYFRIQGKCGEVYPYAEDTVAVLVTAPRAKRLMTFLSQYGERTLVSEDGAIYKVPSAKAGALLRRIKANQRHFLRKETRAAMLSRMAAMRERMARSPLFNCVSAPKRGPKVPQPSLDTLAQEVSPFARKETSLAVWGQGAEMSVSST